MGDCAVPELAWRKTARAGRERGGGGASCGGGGGWRQLKALPQGVWAQRRRVGPVRGAGLLDLGAPRLSQRESKWEGERGREKPCDPPPV